MTLIHKNYKGTPGRNIGGISLTVPDQCMSLRTMLQRYAKGLPITGNPQTPIYNGENDIPFDVRNLDLSEREDLINANKERINNLQADLRAKKAQKAAKKAIEDERREDENAKEPQKEPKSPPPDSTNKS